MHALDDVLQIDHPTAPVFIVAGGGGAGEEAWSTEALRHRGKAWPEKAAGCDEIVPAHHVFDRIRRNTNLKATANIFDEIDKALQKLELATGATSPELPGLRSLPPPPPPSQPHWNDGKVGASSTARTDDITLVHAGQQAGTNMGQLGKAGLRAPGSAQGVWL